MAKQKKKKSSGFVTLLMIAIVVYLIIGGGSKKETDDAMKQSSSQKTIEHTAAQTEMPTPNIRSMTPESALDHIVSAIKSDKIVPKKSNVQNGNELFMEFDVINYSKSKYFIMYACNAALSACKIAKDCPAVSSLLFDFNYQTKDKYGNDILPHGMDIVVNRDTIDKINYTFFENEATYSQLLDVFDYIDVVPEIVSDL